MDDLKIKSKDLCERCIYGEDNCTLDCMKCGQYNRLASLCYCDLIQHGTPCLDFMEKDEDY